MCQTVTRDILRPVGDTTVFETPQCPLAFASFRVFTVKHARVIFRKCELQEKMLSWVLKLKNQLEDAERKQRDTPKVTTFWKCNHLFNRH